MSEEDSINEYLDRWRWQDDAQLIALEFDEYPHWDNFDQARNVLANVLATAYEVLTTSLGASEKERRAMAYYYYLQYQRLVADMPLKNQESSVENPDQSDDN